HTYELSVSEFNIHKSSISRHFVQATAEQMREFKGHLLVAALGLDRAEPLLLQLNHGTISLKTRRIFNSTVDTRHDRPVTP
ncbi:MAG: hypothetical protein M1510_09235, partial [Nitrospirae bacterium]|nr:hypothetical protein [Nitrospirota bacterium]